jgi:hypothetical protein
MNDDPEKFDLRFAKAQAAARGTRLHAFAKECIALGIKLPEIPQTMNQYVNDAIGFRMAPEVTLFYSINAYGTADTIGFSRRENMLRIHDYKSGVAPSSKQQLYVYAAYFCLEYNYKPHEINTELRIYQNNEVKIYPADPVHIAYIMDRIKTLDKRIEELKAELAA